MAFIALKYSVAILAFCLIFTPFKCYGSDCKMSVEEEIVLKQGNMDLRIEHLESMMRNTREEIENDHELLEHLEDEHAKHLEFVNLLANVSEGRDFIKAYRSESCVSNISPGDYTGHMSTTLTGKTCQRWDHTYPHDHDYNDVSTFPEDSLHEASNYCRDPSGSGYLWCFTTDPYEEWETCTLTRCETEFDPETCYGFDDYSSKSYNGHVSVTYTGKTCQRWSSQYPHDHDLKDATYIDGSEYAASNYCRDPEGWGQPWCYTTDPDTRWELCDIARCIK